MSRKIDAKPYQQVLSILHQQGEPLEKIASITTLPLDLIISVETGEKQNIFPETAKRLYKIVERLP